jgi:thioredoxin reductase (NADPH)
MFTAEELRQAKIFACLDEAECARVAQNAADIRLQPGEWLVRSGETAWFYVLYEGRIVAEVIAIPIRSRCLSASPTLIARP